MKEYVRKQIDREDILGKFATRDDFNLYIDDDCDLYSYNPNEPVQKDEGNIIFKFRKGVFSQREQDLAYEGLREGATESQNRGLAAGPRGETLVSGKRGARAWVEPYQEQVIEYRQKLRDLPQDYPELDDAKEALQTLKPQEELSWL